MNQRVCLFEPVADSGTSRSYLFMALKPLLAYIQNYASGTTIHHIILCDERGHRILIYHAMTPPTRNALEELGLLKG